MGIYGYIYGYIWVYMGIFGGKYGYIWVHKTYAWVYMGIYRHGSALAIDFWLILRLN